MNTFIILIHSICFILRWCPASRSRGLLSTWRCHIAQSSSYCFSMYCITNTFIKATTPYRGQRSCKDYIVVKNNKISHLRYNFFFPLWKQVLKTNIKDWKPAMNHTLPHEKEIFTTTQEPTSQDYLIFTYRGTFNFKGKVDKTSSYMHIHLKCLRKENQPTLIIFIISLHGVIWCLRLSNFLPYRFICFNFSQISLIPSHSASVTDSEKI